MEQLRFILRNEKCAASIWGKALIHWSFQARGRCRFLNVHLLKSAPNINPVSIIHLSPGFFLLNCERCKKVISNTHSMQKLHHLLFPCMRDFAVNNLALITPPLLDSVIKKFQVSPASVRATCLNSSPQKLFTKVREYFKYRWKMQEDKALSRPFSAAEMRKMQPWSGEITDGSTDATKTCRIMDAIFFGWIMPAERLSGFCFLLDGAVKRKITR